MGGDVKKAYNAVNGDFTRFVAEWGEAAKEVVEIWNMSGRYVKKACREHKTCDIKKAYNNDFGQFLKVVMEHEHGIEGIKGAVAIWKDYSRGGRGVRQEYNRNFSEFVSVLDEHWDSIEDFQEVLQSWKHACEGKRTYQRGFWEFVKAELKLQDGLQEQESR